MKYKIFLNGTDFSFCCVTCATDYMLDSGKLAVEVNTDEEDND